LKKKIAIVHEFFNKLGGAERTLLCMLDALKDFDVEVFILQADEKLVKAHLQNYKVNLSWVNKLPRFLSSKSRIWIGLYPRIIESFDLSKFDCVISSSNSFAHGVVTNSNTKQITYYHSPCRYLWDWKNEYEKENKFGFFKKIIVRTLLFKQRQWDFLSAQRADVILANSETVKSRIKKYYKREAQVLYPPVNIGQGHIIEQKSNYYLLASTHTPYKKIDLAIEAFNQLGLKLKIAGSGKDTPRLKRLAKNNIEFLGFVSDDKLWDLMQHAKAFIFPGTEDFGITPVEAMGRGCPVIARNAGGLTETVIHNKTGILYDGSTESLKLSVREFESNSTINLDDCVSRAEIFSEITFKENFKKIICDNV
jgi:glycosyltransferase involved in cell wall biosynthesis